LIRFDSRDIDIGVFKDAWSVCCN